MLKAEWAWLKQHKFYLLVIFVLFFVPSIYAVTFLSSLWDPYGAVKNLPVAVVNHDKSVKYQGKKLTVGSDLKKQLEKSKAMDFSFPTDAAAKKGLKDGKYYTVITIPENFSKNATTLLDSSLRRWCCTMKRVLVTALSQGSCQNQVPRRLRLRFQPK